MGFFATSIGYFAFCALHLVCFALALAVCGLYGQDLNHAHRQHVHSDSKWVSNRLSARVWPPLRESMREKLTPRLQQVYAVVVGALSAVTCVVWFVPALLRHAGVFGAVWNSILFILWITLFGVFGALFIHENAEGDSDIQRMKNAVWVDLTSALLWLVSAVATTVYWWRHRDARSTFTGRARV
ncbi:hypothetical protein MGU_10029 [Metarhizium guizhouense ARSEF 977]|uniref:MARVEL domain-containing protein n=1 Tax=Metarhizium guizhouense (strain ARSEF 977) TaxID=1276136 RepID=A0A0B4HT76_METGA|nr:hypothetical protein MGU_10029 [Metarhizium guizhouense ARSEF 977]